MDKGANAEELPAISCHKNALLHSAAVIGDIAMVRVLLDRGAGVNKKNAFGRTPLLLAVECDGMYQLPLVRLLLERGADVKAKDVSSRTALHIVTTSLVSSWWRCGWHSKDQTKTPVISLLLRRGADVNARDKPNADA